MLKLLLCIFIFTPGLLQAATSPLCPDEEGFYYTNYKSKRNPRKGGFVSESANVGDNVFIAPTAAVCGSASVLKYARVYGKAVVTDEAEVTNSARVYGNARVSGSAVISDEAKVSGYAHVSGEAVVKGTAWVKGFRKVKDGELAKGTYSAPKPQWKIKEEQKEAKQKAQRDQAKKSETDAKALKALRDDQKWELRKIQKKMKTGAMGKERGYSYAIKWEKGDIKPPCVFYLNKISGSKTLNCTKFKKVFAKGCYRKVPTCQTSYETLGELKVDLKEMVGIVSQDYMTKNWYVVLSGGHKFYKSNERYANEFLETLKAYQQKHCSE